MSFDLAVVLGFLVVSAGLLWVLLLLGKFLRMRRPGADKLSTYECGEPPFGSAWFNFNNRFYVIALVFVAFDVQVALAVPAIVVFRRVVGGDAPGLLVGVVFTYLGLMMLALAYVWRHGDLSWVRELAAAGRVATLPSAKTRAVGEVVNTQAPPSAEGI